MTEGTIPAATNLTETFYVTIRASVYTIFLRQLLKLNGNYPHKQHDQCIKPNVLYKVSGTQFPQNKSADLF